MKSPELVLDWLLAAAMSLLLPVGPIVAAVIARDRSYVRQYWHTIVKGFAHLRGQVESRAFSRYVMYSHRERPTSQQIVGKCTNCGQCCLNKKCIFLDWTDAGESRCRIYGSAFWKGLACGRYPEDQFDIDLYACPTFYSIPANVRQFKRKQIPIVAQETKPRRARAR